jgi:hypothetical protein
LSFCFSGVKTLVKVGFGFLPNHQFGNLDFIVYSFTKFDRSVGQTAKPCLQWLAFGGVHPKMILTLLLLGEDIFRIGAGSVNYFWK